MTLVVSPGYSQEAVQLDSKLVKIRGDVYHVTNVPGGNVAVLLAGGRTLVVDTGSTVDGVERIKSAISEVRDQPIHLVVNTHWHSDHVAGNEKMYDLGATIIAHGNVKQRMLSEQYIEFLDRKVPVASGKAVPQLTFSGELNLTLNGNDVHVFQIQPGHTDTDAVVFFRSANVIHLGDLYFNGLYPYIGISSGGSIDDVIKVVHVIVSKIDDETVVIPGHGALSNKAELTSYVTMLTTVRDRVESLMKEGKSLDEIIASGPTREYDDPWGKPWLQPEDFVRLVYMDLSRN
jgi:glyoxylase-like metal-dependent hydrolase (beta-lactamase superfamily II)